MEAAINAFDDNGLKEIATLRRTLSAGIHSNVFVLDTRIGRFYIAGVERYISNEPRIKMADFSESKVGGKTVAYNVRYINDVRGNEKMQNLLAADLLSDGPVFAPHAEFARKALEEAAAFSGAGWETFYLNLAQKVISEKRIDPILRLQLAVQLLNYASATAPFAQAKLNQYLQKLQEHDRLANWMDPEDEAAKELRILCSLALDDVRGMDLFIESMKTRIAKMDDALAAYAPAGVILSRDALHLPGLPAEGEVTLYAIAGGAVRIGTAADGKVAFELPAHVKAGTPIYTKMKR